ncbi:MAG: 3-hydroxyacyl-ACP dehydratase FabZ [Clostridiales bacterium]|nr:3-hydroxyacyl-ACP dehydratase FabZ [Clostridiales bacterium]
MEQYDIKKIMEVLPHRQPFLLIDRVLENEPGVRAVVEKYVTMNEPFFAGHFPGEPVMPGVLILEAMAQAGGFCILTMPENKGRLAFLGGVDKAKFRRMVTPGGVLRFEVDILKLKSVAGIGSGTAYFNGEKACEAEFTFILK